MLRLAARRVHPIRPISTRMTVLPPPPALFASIRQLSSSTVRFNESSGTAGSQSEKPQRVVEQLQDWSAKELTYEELKPRTEQPTEVCTLLSACKAFY